MIRYYGRDGFNATSLDSHCYVCGIDYFENSQRWYPARRDEECVSVVHNNWIVSREAKIYRFKEHLMWMYDKGRDGIYGRYGFVEAD
jgi:hypothetical protein